MQFSSIIVIDLTWIRIKNDPESMVELINILILDCKSDRFKLFNRHKFSTPIYDSRLRAGW